MNYRVGLLQKEKAGYVANGSQWNMARRVALESVKSEGKSAILGPPLSVHHGLLPDDVVGTF